MDAESIELGNLNLGSKENIKEEIPKELNKTFRLIPMEHIYEEIPPVELEFDFEVTELIVPTLRNHQILKVKNCLSISSALTTIRLFVDGFFKRFISALCVHYFVQENVTELNEIEFFSFVENFKGFNRSFIIIFEAANNSCVINWRLKDTLQIFSLIITKNSVKFNHFVIDFLFKSLKNGFNGIHSAITYNTNQLRVFTDPYMLADHRKFDLLFLACEHGDVEIVKFLINLCDMKYVCDGKTATDIAYEKNNHDVLLFLLKANSRFPNNFKQPKNISEISEEYKNFLLMSKKVHDAVRDEDEEEVLKYLNLYPGLKYFFDFKNVSLLAYIFKRKAFNIYKLLINRNLSLGPHEIFADLLKNLSDKEREELGEIHDENVQPLAEKHIMTLMANANVGFDDNERQSRLAVVFKGLQRLNTIEKVKLILEIVAATRNFEIIFDFNRDHVQFIDPTAESYMNGLFYLSGRIYIAAMHLLNEQRAHEVLGVIAHELCHYVMFKIFNNLAKPFRAENKLNEEEFNGILTRTKEICDQERIVSRVYESYKEEQQPAELIVRVVHILGHYIDQPEKVQELEGTFSELVAYYNEKCHPVMVRRLPEIVAESEEQIRKIYAKPSSILKLYWKWITLIMMFVLLGSTVFFIITKKECISDEDCPGNKFCRNAMCVQFCDDTTCGYDNNAYCEVTEDLLPTCKCHFGLSWNGVFCHCDLDENCPLNLTCVNHQCINTCDLQNQCGLHDEAFCKVENHKALCKCHSNMIWSSGSCFQCLSSNDCNFNYPCIDFECKSTLFLCRGENKTLPRVEICDGIAQCADESDEENCVNGRVHENTFVVTKKFLSTASKLKETAILKTAQFIKSELNKNISELSFTYGLDFPLLPNEISRKFPKLTKFKVYKCNVQKISKIIFFGLNELINLDLSDNFISQVEEDSFESLEKLEKISLRKNQISILPPKLIKYCINLKNIDLSTNNIKEIPSMFFEYNSKLNEIRLEYNSIQQIEPNSFKGLHEIRSIHLFYNKIQLIHENSFIDLQRIELIDLNTNMISFLPKNILRFSMNLRSLILTENKLLSLPENFFEQCKSMQEIILLQNQIKFISRNIFKGLRNMTELNLLQNHIESIDEYAFEELENLEVLNLGENKISHLPPKLFYNLKKLTSIILWGNYISVLPANIFNFNLNVETITLDRNILVKISKNIFSGRRHLVDLSLEDSEIKQVEEGSFDGLEDLLELNLMDNKISTLSANLFYDLKQLEKLYLRLNSIKHLPQNIFQFNDKLMELRLQDNQILSIEKNTFYGLENLINLYLGRNQISSFETNSFNSLKKLKYLDLSENKISTIPSTIFQSLEEIEGISLAMNNIEVLDENILESNEKLTSINLSHNRITRIEANIFRRNNKIENINLSSNKIEFMEKTLFAGLTKLHTLVLAHNKIKILTLTFQNSENLNIIDLRQNFIEHVDDNIFNEIIKFKCIGLLGNRCINKNFGVFDGNFCSIYQVNGHTKRLKIKNEIQKSCLKTNYPS